MQAQPFADQRESDQQQKALGQDFSRRAALDESADRADEDHHENHGDDDDQ